MKKILVVDDERPISDIIKFNLTKEGYEVVTAFDGREALEQFEAEKPDLVILDLMLPELDGLEVAKEIRKTSHTPIIMLSWKPAGPQPGRCPAPRSYGTARWWRPDGQRWWQERGQIGRASCRERVCKQV